MPAAEIKIIRQMRGDCSLDMFSQIELNIQQIEQTFKDCGDFVGRKIPIGKQFEKTIYVAYVDGLTNTDIITRTVNKIMIISQLNDVGTDFKTNLFYELKNEGVTTLELKESDKFDDLYNGLLSGETVILVDGFSKAIIFSTKGWPSRGVGSAETEIVVQGPKDALTENLRSNTAIIRRRIKDINLKVKQMSIGRRSKTNVGILYLDDVVRPKILRDVEKRLKNIDIDAILDCGYINQLIGEDWLSPFPQTQITERPDKAASAIYEGRIVILVDNSPFAIIVPTTLITFYQASDDYYQSWQIASLTRFLRYIAGFIAIALPGIYIALSVFHPSMIPMQLVYKMAETRNNVPFPAVIEVLIMEIAFELLREAGLRLPRPVGSAIGIIGGLIVGQAAVEAGIVCHSVVIVVALTGIASFVIPNYSLASGYRIMKFLIIVFSAILGLFGFWAAMIIILIHLASLKSFGIPYLFPFASGDINGYSDWKDTIFRVPIFAMKKRPFFANPNQRNRLKITETGNKREKE